jgi:superfamily II DNA or RNA helicase/HKD family nuclease
MSQLVRGLHETIITEAVEETLSRLPAGVVSLRDPMRPAEVADRLGIHIYKVLERHINDLSDDDRVVFGVNIARKIIELISQEAEDEMSRGERPIVSGELLNAVLGFRPDGSVSQIHRPLTPLLDTVLLANSPGEPNVGHQVRQEIESADRVDLIMAFIRKSGINPLLPALERHCKNGRAFRVLTTTYTGSTEASALDILRNLGAEIKVSYDVSSTRLHAKAWLFHRDSGFSTTYIGSSNLTHQAQHTGLEWNIRVSGVRNPTVLEKVRLLFESYWVQGEFQPYDRGAFDQAIQNDQRTGLRALSLPPTDVHLLPFQEQLLERIAIAREQGHHRNLLVSATGTGKTVMAAIDYQRLRSKLPRSRLLFVAHRKEILRQARATFCHALREPSFGELWVDGEAPTDFDHVFASIQTLASNGLSDLPPDHFDVVIVDEFHHAAARTYALLLNHVNPRELLGLTATPERADGLSVIDHFDGRIAAELRLWDAIEQKQLCPFFYYGIHDDVDFTQVAWHRGRGYDVDGLTNVLTADDARARFVLQELNRVVDDIDRIRCLGFCVSVAHARFMARVFNAFGVSSTAIWADTNVSERETALHDLQTGRIRVLFSVDLFNEGIDLPAVDTLLMLRPTESATLFLQQLGRGLRLHKGKSLCTVLDFVGRHRAEFRFDQKLCTLLRISKSKLREQIDQGFPFLPAGCHFELQPKAQETIVASLRNAIPFSWRDKVQAVSRATHEGDCSLVKFLSESGLELEDVYRNHSWSDLRAAANLPLLAAGPNEKRLRKAIGRMLHIDDELRTSAYITWLSSPTPPDPASLDKRSHRLLRMLVASLTSGIISSDTSLAKAAMLVWDHPQVCAEARELLSLLLMRRSHQHHPIPGRSDSPLLVHARYTRVEIQAALDDGCYCKPPPWREGVRWLPAANTDLAVVTLDKTKGQFSPTTRYRDYAIDTQHIHWESQSRTRAESPTGLRYREHQDRGSDMLLFARESIDESAFWFIGRGVYQGHDGDAPMSIIWKLEHPLPGDLFAAFAAAVA